MPRNKRNSIRIFWIENGKEATKRIYPKNVPEIKWENGFELYHFGLTHVCRFFNCLSPDELLTEVRWCYDTLPTAYMNPDLSWEEKAACMNTDEYQYWLELKIESMCCACCDSMFSDAYMYTKYACKHHNNGQDVDDVDPALTNRKWKEPFWINYLFDEYLGYQNSYIPTGAWIFRDGSYITVDSGNHRRIVEEYMKENERDVETRWVKVQLYSILSHPYMTDAQKKTINKFLKQYPNDLHESMVLWDRENY